MKYTIECVGTNAGPRYRVTLWLGSVAYVGNRTYERQRDAEQAAKATGAAAKQYGKGAKE